MKSPELKIFTGPMFGGKTTRMLAALERYQYQHRSTIQTADPRDSSRLALYQLQKAYQLHIEAKIKCKNDPEI